ncbi:MAG: succinate dehydrogenase/fumarate reductase iron-sulfur subunit [Candidatus Lokiarchaeota archaeon]|nr:succinate dehydrogenase/fumarate reductase iron-sulfur subunit [Candidatus Lokiarchaeota archaeon]
MSEKQKFLVYRNLGNESVQYKRYEVPLSKGMSILDALFYIQDYYDSNFAFRYACRGAICGSCGMTIDKVPILACRTQVVTVKAAKKPINLPEVIFGDVSDWDQENEILIEPLPNMTVIKDLVVDMEPFWKFYREIEPYFTKDWSDIAPESTQSPNEMKRIERLVYCILCGICWMCPVNAKNPDYLGPAQLAKSDRFVRDSRVNSEKQDKIISRVLQNDAVPACEKFFVCNRVCPKGVLPGIAIKDIRDNWISEN